MEPQEDSLPQEFTLNNVKFTKQTELHRSQFGIVWRYDQQPPENDALPLKLEVKGSNGDSTTVNKQGHYLSKVQKDGNQHIPKYYGDRLHGSKPYIIMEFVEYSVEEYLRRFKDLPNRLSLAQIFSQMLSALEALHASGYVNQLVKPSNFRISEENKVYLNHLGHMSELVWQGRHKAKGRYGFQGNPQYASIDQLEGYTMSRKDDLESLGYTMMYLTDKEVIPWNDLQTYKEIRQSKVDFLEQYQTPDQYLQFRRFILRVRHLAYEEDPDYNALRYDIMHLVQQPVVPNPQLNNFVLQQEQDQNDHVDMLPDLPQEQVQVIQQPLSFMEQIEAQQRVQEEAKEVQPINPFERSVRGYQGLPQSNFLDQTIKVPQPQDQHALNNSLVIQIQQLVLQHYQQSQQIEIPQKNDLAQESFNIIELIRAEEDELRPIQVRKRAMEAEVTKLQEEHKELKKANSELKVEQSKLKLNIKELEDNCSLIEGEIEMLNIEKKRIQLEIEQDQAQYIKQQEDQAYTAARNLQLEQEQLQKSKDEISQLTIEIQELKQIRENKEIELALIQKENAEFQEIIYIQRQVAQEQLQKMNDEHAEVINKVQQKKLEYVKTAQEQAAFAKEQQEYRQNVVKQRQIDESSLKEHNYRLKKEIEKLEQQRQLLAKENQEVIIARDKQHHISGEFRKEGQVSVAIVEELRADQVTHQKALFGALEKLFMKHREVTASTIKSNIVQEEKKYMEVLNLNEEEKVNKMPLSQKSVLQQAVMLNQTPPQNRKTSSSFMDSTLKYATPHGRNVSLTKECSRTGLFDTSIKQNLSKIDEKISQGATVKHTSAKLQQQSELINRRNNLSLESRQNYQTTSNENRRICHQQAVRSSRQNSSHQQSLNIDCRIIISTSEAELQQIANQKGFISFERILVTLTDINNPKQKHIANILKKQIKTHCNIKYFSLGKYKTKLEIQHGKELKELQGILLKISTQYQQYQFSSGQLIMINF
ncbi:hypothetical protein FGO68_gene11523 [Halteria grandinella]|uniref:Casein kinase I n=1 Tax=Halteria grandinella TaxID=5974 RepID=A0A8J8NZH1_HALGN|nr:hypothetical protein FGO68_gene11523 [Halteria grandinella]